MNCLLLLLPADSLLGDTSSLILLFRILQETKVTNNGLRVLCVDDNHDAADSVAHLLEIFGFEVRVCYDGPTAITIAEKFHPQICLIDLNMPGMDGDEVVIRLRESGKPVLLVAMTAMSNEHSRQRIAKAGFDLHLVKPFDPCQLPKVLSSLWQTSFSTF
jgi:two-component system, OmpR family, response regulator